MKPSFNLEDIKATTDPPTYQKAVDLYNKKKIIQFKEELNGYSAVVKGSELYDVYVDMCQCNKGGCNCYLGQHDIFCKHMVAVAIYAVMNGQKLTTQDENITQGPVCGELTKDLTKEEVGAFKKEISCAMKFIKPYTGGSRK
ncbi:MAG: hypothetical protein PHO23_00885 [Candidatus Pacebacteria bacterium]|nr:hypothetical protein [Candidatus Paceibacterota bacterium]